MYAWPDSLPTDHCRERTLAVLGLWQDVRSPSIDLVARIVNHLILLGQMTFYLECLTIDNDLPAMPGIHVENIILNLVNEPQLSAYVWRPFSLTYISEEEIISLERAACRRRRYRRISQI